MDTGEEKWEANYAAVRNVVEQRLQRIWYPFQRKLIRRVMRSLTLEDSGEIAALVSRQSGKSTCIADLVYALCIMAPIILKDRLQKNGEFTIGIFAPKEEQAKGIIFRLVKRNFESEKSKELLQALGISIQESNGDTFTLSNGSRVKCVTASKNATITGLTLNLAIIDEAQDVDETKILADIYPMTAAIGGTRLLIGTPNFQVGYLYKVCERGKGTPDIIITPWREVVKEKNYLFSVTKDPFHLKYEKSVVKDMKTWGAKDDRFRTQYALEWITERAMVITATQLVSLKKKYGRLKTTENPVWVGIDLGKVIDSTIVTVVGIHDPLTGKLSEDTTYVYNWLELLGDNHEDQYGYIESFLKQYPNIVNITIDETGIGGPIVDRFKANTAYQINGIKFTPQWNSDIYERCIREMLNNRVQYPDIDEPILHKFEEQWMNLTKEFKGNLIKCEPLEENGHDDTCDSLALAVWGVKDAGRTQYKAVGSLDDMFKEQNATASRMLTPEAFNLQEQYDSFDTKGYYSW